MSVHSFLSSSSQKHVLLSSGRQGNELDDDFDTDYTVNRVTAAGTLTDTRTGTGAAAAAAAEYDRLHWQDIDEIIEYAGEFNPSLFSPSATTAASSSSSASLTGAMLSASVTQHIHPRQRPTGWRRRIKRSICYRWCTRHRHHVLYVFVACIALTAIALAVLAVLSAAGDEPSLVPQVEVDVLVIGYDAGETNAFVPVLHQVRQQHVGWTFAMLVMATSERITQGDTSLNRIRLQQDIGISSFDPNGPRTQLLSDNDVIRVTNYVRPRTMVLTGMVSGVQRQLIKAYQDIHQGISLPTGIRHPIFPSDNEFQVHAHMSKPHVSRVSVSVPSGNDTFPLHRVGYYDALAWSPGSITTAFMNGTYVLDTMLVPSTLAQTGAHTIDSELSIVTVGNPSIDTWVRDARSTQRSVMRARLLNNVDWAMPQPSMIVVYAGGYGSDYEQSFSLFINSCQMIQQQLPFGNNSAFIVSLHPKVDGSTERHIIQQLGAENLVHILPKTFSSANAVYGGDLVTSQDSTVGVQSLFLGRPSIFLNANRHASKNGSIATELGFSPLLFSASSFVSEVKSQYANKFSFDTNRLSAAGIPKNSTEAFVNWLDNVLVA
jgi:hypothetical protein